jgi:hypothetical protein
MRLLFCWCLLLFLVGCGGKGGPELPVSGIVTLDGQPVANAMVRFMPDKDTDPSSTGFGQTGSDGKFVITGGQGKKGLVAGRYKVTVNKAAQIDLKSDEGAGAVVGGPETKDELPAIYSSPAQTILSYSVTGDGKPIEIQLDSKKKK